MQWVPLPRRFSLRVGPRSQERVPFGLPAEWVSPRFEPARGQGDPIEGRRHVASDIAGVKAAGGTVRRFHQGRNLAGLEYAALRSFGITSPFGASRQESLVQGGRRELSRTYSSPRKRCQRVTHSSHCRCKDRVDRISPAVKIRPRIKTPQV